MKLDDSLRVIKLIDAYGKLLTSKQFEIITSYYFDNLSLSEIGDNYSISRQAVSDSINQSIKALDTFEEKLCMVEKNEDVLRDLELVLTLTNDSAISEKIQEIMVKMRG